jgi:hypothetical protein
MEPLTALLAAAALSLASGFLSEVVPALRRIVLRSLRIDLSQKAAEKTIYQERMTRLTNALRQSSSDFDVLLLDMQEVARSREAAVSVLEAKLSELSDREESMRQRIAQLDAVQPEAAREFVRLMDQEQAKGERRSAKRDYILFATGVIVTVVLTLLFHALGIG